MLPLSDNITRVYKVIQTNAWFQASAAEWKRTALFWVITQRVLLIFCRRFGTTFRPHLQNDSLPQKMGPIGCFETSIRNYHYSLLMAQRSAVLILIQMKFTVF